MYVVIGVTVNGERDILGIWAGDGGEGGKVLVAGVHPDQDRGVNDVCIAVCDGLKGLPDAITTAWSLNVVQQSIIHLIRNTFRYASKKYGRRSPPTSSPCTRRRPRPRPYSGGRVLARSGASPIPRSGGCGRPRGRRTRPFLDYDVEIRKVMCSTNAIESINAPHRRAVRARGHFPNEQAALKCLYLATRSPDPTGAGKARWAMRWKPALNAFAITFDGRINPSPAN